MTLANPLSPPAVRGLLNLLSSTGKSFSTASLKRRLAEALALLEENPSTICRAWPISEKKYINIAIDTMRRQAVSYAAEELATVEVLLARIQGQTDEIKQSILQIENLIDH